MKQITTGILLFDGAEELDFAGPYEVFAAAAQERSTGRVVTISPDGQPIRGAKGLRVLPDHSIDDAPALDVVVIPGGDGRRREMRNEAVLQWVRDSAAGALFVTSVCTGAFILHASGVAKGCRMTTHWSAIDELRAREHVEVVERVRFVAAGRVVSAAGVSAGIDMSLWVLGQIHGPAFARDIQHYIEYDPAPPYAFEG